MLSGVFGQNYLLRSLLIINDIPAVQISNVGTPEIRRFPCPSGVFI